MNSYLKSIYVFNSYKSKHFLIDFSSPKDKKFKHLILTGNNGSGKTTILKSLAINSILHKEKLLTSNKLFSELIKINSKTKEFKECFDFDFPKIELNYITGIKQEFDSVFIYIPTQKHQYIEEYVENRKLNFNEKIKLFKNNLVQSKAIKSIRNIENTINNLLTLAIPNGIQSFQYDTYSSAIKDVRKQNPYSTLQEIPRLILSSNFLQFLILLKDEQAYAIADVETEKAEALTKRFANIEKSFQILFEDNKLKLKHQFRGGRKFYFELGDGRIVDFNHLSHGHNAVLTIIAEITLNIEAHRENNPEDFSPKGVVVIDEIESHLHLSLQEKILPVLTQMFPDMQFIVSTHSPAVIASINNATVYDLSLQKTVNENLSGIPYQVLMKSHFGIESEYSIEVTGKLKEVKKLITASTLSESEKAKLEGLVFELQELSPDLALDVQLEMERRKENA